MRVFTDELKATKENLLSTLEKDDLGRNESVLNLASLCCESEGGAIAIDAQWGEGKTFFVKQTKLLLDAYNPNLKKVELTDDERNRIVGRFQLQEGAEILREVPVYSVYYDAWMFDSDCDPALSLAYEIAVATNNEEMMQNGETDVSKAFAAVLKVFTKVDIKDLLASKKTEDYLKEIRDIRERDEAMRGFLKACLPENGNRLVIFVDELDRCNPVFAVSMLERIKHFFDEPNVFFVFSINSIELQHTIKRFYGELFDATKYLNRFFSLRCTLPPVNRKRILDKQYGPASDWFDRAFFCFCEEYNLSLRDISRLKTNINNLKKYISKQEVLFESAGVKFLQNIVVPLMVGLKTVNSEAYEKFVSGRDGTPLLRIVKHDELQSYFGNIRKNAPVETSDSDICAGIYDTVFGSNTGKTPELQFGDFVFNSSMKEILLNHVSQLKSPWAVR